MILHDREKALGRTFDLGQRETWQIVGFGPRDGVRIRTTSGAAFWLCSREFDKLLNSNALVESAQPRCARCHAAPVFAGTLCLRCHEIDSAKQAAQTAAEMAHQLVTR